MRRKSKEIHTWSEDEISIFEKPEGMRERLTFALLLYTGQLGSDVYRMTLSVALEIRRSSCQKHPPLGNSVRPVRSM
jgi:hypothetical protein